MPVGEEQAEEGRGTGRADGGVGGRRGEGVGEYGQVGVGWCSIVNVSRVRLVRLAETATLLLRPLIRESLCAKAELRDFATPLLVSLRPPAEDSGALRSSAGETLSTTATTTRASNAID